MFEAFALQIFGKDRLDRIGVSVKEIGFCLGSLIKPKFMLQQPSDNKLINEASVANIYFYLYKFSLQRLQQFLESKSMTLLLAYYFLEGKHDRIKLSPSMARNEVAYYEAQKIMLKNNCLSGVLEQEFNLSVIRSFKAKQKVTKKSKWWKRILSFSIILNLPW